MKYLFIFLFLVSSSINGMNNEKINQVLKRCLIQKIKTDPSTYEQSQHLLDRYLINKESNRQKLLHGITTELIFMHEDSVEQKIDYLYTSMRWGIFTVPEYTFLLHIFFQMKDRYGAKKTFTVQSLLDNDDNTILHSLVEQREIVDLINLANSIIQHGGNILQKNRNGLSSFAIAMQSDSKKLHEIMQKVVNNTNSHEFQH